MIGLKLGLGKDGKVTSTTPVVEETATFEDGVTATDESGNEMIFD